MGGHPLDCLNGIKLYVIPHWTWFDPAWVEPLAAWTASGNVLVIGRAPQRVA